MTNATWHIPTWQRPWEDDATALELRVTAGPEVEGWVPVVWSGGSGIARANQVDHDDPVNLQAAGMSAETFYGENA